MRVEHFRAHAAYCQERMRSAPNATSRRRWESECADWLNLELCAAQADLPQIEAVLEVMPTMLAPLREQRSFA
jgi:hypothetical protein